MFMLTKSTTVLTISRHQKLLSSSSYYGHLVKMECRRLGVYQSYLTQRANPLSSLVRKPERTCVLSLLKRSHA